MRKIISIIIISITTILVALLIFLTTTGIRTDNFNGLINEKVKEIDPKIKLKLNQVNFKLNPSNFEFEIFTLDPQIAINQKKIEYLKFIINSQIDKLGMHKSYNILEHTKFINNLNEIKNIFLFFDMNESTVFDNLILNLTS